MSQTHRCGAFSPGAFRLSFAPGLWRGSGSGQAQRLASSSLICASASASCISCPASAASRAPQHLGSLLGVLPLTGLFQITWDQNYLKEMLKSQEFLSRKSGVKDG